MTIATLEHVNFTVKDPLKTANMLCDLFGWHIRWQGVGMETGQTFHVGTDDAYVAVFSYGEANKPSDNSYKTIGGLNHIGVVVDDLDAVEDRVKERGFTPTSHSDYEPGRRFYFHDHDDIEFEVISYA